MRVLYNQSKLLEGATVVSSLFVFSWLQIYIECTTKANFGKELQCASVHVHTISVAWSQVYSAFMRLIWTSRLLKSVRQTLFYRRWIWTCGSQFQLQKLLFRYLDGVLLSCFRKDVRGPKDNPNCGLVLTYISSSIVTNV